jgi:hypothetical protein
MKKHLAMVATLLASLTLITALPARADDDVPPCPPLYVDVIDIVVPGLGTW